MAVSDESGVASDTGASPQTISSDKEVKEQEEDILVISSDEDEGCVSTALQPAPRDGLQVLMTASAMRRNRPKMVHKSFYYHSTFKQK